MAKDPGDHIESLRLSLRTAGHGGDEMDALERLQELAIAGNLAARDAIFEHAMGNRGVHRQYAASLLADLSGSLGRSHTWQPLPDIGWANLFERLLPDSVTR